MRFRICMLWIISLAVFFAYAQEIDIRLLEPGTDYVSPSARHKKINIIGEIISGIKITEVSVALVNAQSNSEISCPCSVYQGKKSAIFKTTAKITPPNSLISVAVALDNGERYRKIFPVRTCCSNSQYKKDFKLLVTKQVHKDTVRELEFSLDGKYLISCGDDQVIKILNPVDLSVIKTLKGHNGYVRQAHITPDNRYILSCGDDKTVRMWDVASAKQIHVFSKDEYPLWALAISSDGRYVASGSYRFRVWDLATKKQWMVSTIQKGRCRILCYTPDGRYLISGDSSHNIVIWDTEKNKEKYMRKDAHSDDVVSLGVHPSQKFLYSGGENGYIKWWRVLLDPYDSIWDDESNAMWEMRLKVIKNRKKDPADIPTDILNGNPTGYKTISQYPMYELTKSPRSIASDQLIKKAKKPYSSFSLHGDIVALSLDGSGEYLLLVTRKGEIRIHETFTAYKRSKFLINHPLQCGVFSYDGSMVAIGGISGKVWLYGLPPQKQE